jgi:hypothetical protein
MHTLDRKNFLAMSELIVSSNELVTNETWSIAVEAKFEIDYWPFIQSN